MGEDYKVGSHDTIAETADLTAEPNEEHFTDECSLERRKKSKPKKASESHRKKSKKKPEKKKRTSSKEKVSEVKFNFTPPDDSVTEDSFKPLRRIQSDSQLLKQEETPTLRKIKSWPNLTAEKINPQVWATKKKKKKSDVKKSKSDENL